MFLIHNEINFYFLDPTFYNNHYNHNNNNHYNNHYNHHYHNNNNHHNNHYTNNNNPCTNVSSVKRSKVFDAFLF